MRVVYKNRDREAVWEDAILTGDEIMLDTLAHIWRHPQPQSLTVTGPHLYPDPWSHDGAIAGGMQAGWVLEGDPPESTKLEYGDDDGPNVELVEKHYPGGQDHDQSNHGRKGNPRQLGPNPGQTASRVHGAPLFHPLYDTDTKTFGYKKLRLPDGTLAKFTLVDVLASGSEATKKRFNLTRLSPGSRWCSTRPSPGTR